MEYHCILLLPILLCIHIMFMSKQKPSGVGGGQFFPLTFAHLTENTFKKAYHNIIHCENRHRFHHNIISSKKWFNINNFQGSMLLLDLHSL